MLSLEDQVQELTDKILEQEKEIKIKDKKLQKKRNRSKEHAYQGK